MEKRKTINRQNITDHLIEYQLKIIGKTIDEVTNDEKWFTNNTMTPEQHEEFKAYAIPLLKKYLSLTKRRQCKHSVGLICHMVFALNPN